MQRLFICLLFSSLCTSSLAQHIYKIKTDSLLVTNDSCNAELILENETKFVDGFLYNKGKGRTIFKQAMIKLNDSMYVFGGDTLNFRNLLNTIGFSGTNIYNTDGTLSGNRVINSNGHQLTFTGNLTVGSGTNAGLTTNATNFYVDGLSSGAGSIFFRNWASINLYNPVNAGLINANSINVSSNNTVASVAGTGVTSFRIGNAGSSTTWFFENHRNAIAGSLEISNSLEVPGLVLFPNRNISIGSYTDNGYKLDVHGTGRFTGNVNINGILIGQNSGDRFINADLNQIDLGTGGIRYGSFSANHFAYSGRIVLKANNIQDRIILSDEPTSVVPGTAGSEIGFNPVYNHISTASIIRVYDYSYGGGTQVTGHLYMYAGKNTTDNSLGNIILQHDGTNSRGLVGIGTQTPTAKLDINGTTGHSQFRLRTSYTPTSTSDTNGNVGDFSWDDNYFYIKTSAGWKRSALSTF